MANTCAPGMQAVCKVKLFYSTFKYDGECYRHCGCDCPSITIWMRRVDAVQHIKRGKAQFAADDAECTPCGSCCERALAQLGG